MAKIIAPYLFSWKDVDELGDLQRLRFVSDNLADDCLIERLLKERGKGRNRYPVRAMWNSILAGIVFEHQSIEHLRRELSRNAQLRELCGFNPLQGATAVPTAWAYSRFIKQLVKHSAEIEQLSQALVSQLHEILPGFGENIAADSKAISSHGRPPQKQHGGRAKGYRCKLGGKKRPLLKVPEWAKDEALVWLQASLASRC